MAQQTALVRRLTSVQVTAMFCNQQLMIVYNLQRIFFTKRNKYAVFRYKSDTNALYMV